MNYRTLKNFSDFSGTLKPLYVQQIMQLFRTHFPQKTTQTCTKSHIKPHCLRRCAKAGLAQNEQRKCFCFARLAAIGRLI